MSTATLALRLAPSVPWIIVACGLLAIAEISGWIDVPFLGAGLKPLTTLLIVLHAMRLPFRNAFHRRWILSGLWCSFAAECAMAVPDTFVVGLYLFILAQCSYLTALMGGRFSLARIGMVHVVHAVAVAWALVLWSARPLGIYLPVCIFMCLLGLMSTQADLWWLRSRGTREAATARGAALGGLFWMLADLVWTYAQFVQWLPATFAIVLPLYWLAQWHLAATIGKRGT